MKHQGSKQVHGSSALDNETNDDVERDHRTKSPGKEQTEESIVDDIAQDDVQDFQ